MRGYWIRIALGALAIFAVGMVGVTLVRRGVSGVREVTEGSGPISIPLAFIPFSLGGNKLGSLERVTLHRETPRLVTSVELEIKLRDSMTARGLEGCRLATNFEGDQGSGGVSVHRGPFSDGHFWCVVASDSANAELVEYGVAVLRPGDVTVPLLLSRGLVDELRDFDLGTDTTMESAETEADSVMAAIELAAESAAAAPNRVRERLVDSLRAEGLRRADSARRVLRQMADSVKRR
jgi:hypothetical protein